MFAPHRGHQDNPKNAATAPLFMNPTLWAIVAAVPAVWMEYFYRTMRYSWWHYIWLFGPVSLFISYAICKLVTQPGVPLVGALIFWSLSVIGIRIVVTVWLLHDHVPNGTWAALALLLAARIVQATWR